MRKRIYNYYRHPKTTAEKRANQEGWCRHKRLPNCLPDTYDDICPHTDKCWKSRKLYQYSIGGRGQRHTIRIDTGGSYSKFNHVYNTQTRRFEKYCYEHNVPYRIDNIDKFRWREYVTYKYNRESNTYDTTHSGKYFRSYYTAYYILNWWSDKDIGINYIL